MVQPIPENDCSAPRCIVVVEPNLPQRLLYLWELEEAGHKVVTHSSVPDAIRYSTSERPDLLLVDAGLDTAELPGTMAALRAAFPDVAIVLHTASCVCHDAGAARLADAFVHKSSDLDGLKQLVQALATVPRSQPVMPLGVACLN